MVELANPKPGRRVLSTTEAGERIGCSGEWVRRLIKARKLEALWAGGRWWVNGDSVAAYEREHAT
jgi:excisionase family DNA binding protein